MLGMYEFSKFPGTCTSDSMAKCAISFGVCVLYLVCFFQLAMEFFPLPFLIGE